MNKELAIECIKTQRQFVDDLTREAFDIAIDLLKQPERKKGKWINIREGNRADCDQCGQSGRAWMNFCFDCGADMREDGEADANVES